MHAPRCKVTFVDSEGILHEVQVYADSVYEAIGQAVKEFRAGSLPPSLPGPMTEFSVEVQRPPRDASPALQTGHELGRKRHA